LEKLLLLPLLPLLLQLLLDLVDLLGEEMVVLGPGIGHLVHVSLYFLGIGDQIAHSSV
jgi:hypothetical protein